MTGRAAARRAAVAATAACVALAPAGCGGHRGGAATGRTDGVPAPAAARRACALVSDAVGETRASRLDGAAGRLEVESRRLEELSGRRGGGRLRALAQAVAATANNLRLSAAARRAGNPAAAGQALAAARADRALVARAGRRAGVPGCAR